MKINGESPSVSCTLGMPEMTSNLFSSILVLFILVFSREGHLILMKTDALKLSSNQASLSIDHFWVAVSSSEV